MLRCSSFSCWPASRRPAIPWPSLHSVVNSWRDGHLHERLLLPEADALPGCLPCDGICVPLLPKPMPCLTARPATASACLTAASRCPVFARPSRGLALARCPLAGSYHSDRDGGRGQPGPHGAEHELVVGPQAPLERSVKAQQDCYASSRFTISFRPVIDFQIRHLAEVCPMWSVSRTSMVTAPALFGPTVFAGLSESR